MASECQFSHSRRSVVQAWVVVLVASLYFFYEFIQMNMVGSLAGSFESNFHLTTFQLALIACFYFLSDSLLLYPAGAILDHVSSKFMMVLGLLMCILGTYLITFAVNAWFLVGARFLAGMTSAFCLLSILRLAAQWFPPAKLGLVSGVIISIGMMGGAFAQQPLSQMIVTFGWREAIYLVGIAGIVILFLVLFLVKDAPKGKRYAALHTDPGVLARPWHVVLMQVLKNKKNWLAGLYTSTMNLPIMILAGLFGTQLVAQETQSSHVNAAWASTMIFVGTIFGSVAFGYVSDRLKNRRKPMLGAAIICVAITGGLILLAGKLTLAEFVIAFFLLGMGSAAQVLGYPVVREVNRGEDVGSAMGFISVLIMVLPTLLQPLTGWLLQLGWQSVFSHGVPVYSVAEYTRIFWIILVGFVVSITCVLKLPETYPQTGESK